MHNNIEPPVSPEARSRQLVGLDNDRSSQLLKAMSHPERLLALALLDHGPKSVSELERRLGLRQAAVSQLLQRLRSDGLVTSRRRGKSVQYSIVEPVLPRLLAVLRERFPDEPQQAAEGAPGHGAALADEPETDDPENGTEA